MSYRLAVIHAINVLNGERLNAGRSHHRQAVYAMARRIKGQEHTSTRKHLGRWLSRAIATLLAEEVLVSERRGFIGLSSKARRRLVDVGKQLGPFDGLSRFKKIQYLKAIAGSSTRRASAKSRSKTVPVVQYDALKKEIQALHEQLKCVQAENANLREQRMDDDEATTLDEYLGRPVDTPGADLPLDREYSHTSRQTPEQPRAESFEVPRTPVRPGPHSLTLSPYSITGSFVDVHSGRLSPISVTPDVLCRDLMGEPVGSPDSWDGDANSDDGLYEERGNQQTRMDGGLLSPRATSPQRPETRQPHSSDDMPDEFDEDLEGLIQDCPPQPNNHYVSPPEIEELRKKLAEAEADLERWKAKEAQTTDVYFTQTTKLATTRCELEETNVELKSLREYLARVENGAEWQGESARDRVIGLEAELRQVSRELAAAKEKIQAAMEAMGPGQSNLTGDAKTGSPRLFANRRRRHWPVRGKVSSRELRESGIAMLTHVLKS